MQALLSGKLGIIPLLLFVLLIVGELREQILRELKQEK